MTPLDRLIRDEIQASGPVSVARFMEIALQHPEHGYYVTRDPLGAKGDFITAPEISQMFGEMIGLWAAELWQSMGAPSAFTLLELGPGRGTLMQDLLRATKRIPGFAEAARVTFLESSPTLRAAQAEKLQGTKIAYVEDLSALPDLPLLCLANEFFDALPIRQFVKRPKGWMELKIGGTVPSRLDSRLRGNDDKGEGISSLHANDDRVTLSSAVIPASSPVIPAKAGIPFVSSVDMLTFVETIPDAPFREPPAYGVWEECLPAQLIMRRLAEHVAAHGGGMLILDYGYAAPPESFTLQAVEAHAMADPLENIGERDLTAHVDFRSLGSLARDAGLRVMGPVGQGDFLHALGIGLRAARLKLHATETQQKDIDQALHRLTDSGEMGVLFKAMAVVQKNILESAGFP